MWNVKNLEIDKYVIITFSLQRHLALFKNLFFVFVSFALVVMWISISLVGNKYFIISFSLHIISFPFLVSSKKLNFHVSLVLLDCDVRLRNLKNYDCKHTRQCHLHLCRGRLMNIIYRKWNYLPLIIIIYC